MRIIKSITEALKALSFAPRAEGLFTHNNEMIPDKVAVFSPEGYVATVGVDHDLSPMGESFGSFSSVMGELGGKFDKLVTWNNTGAFRSFWSMPEFEVGAGDKHVPQIVLSGSIDGTLRQSCSLSVFRLVCSNGMGVMEIKASAFAKRSKGFEANWANRAQVFYGEVMAEVEKTAARFNALALKPMSMEEAEAILAKVITGDSTRASNQREDILARFVRGIGNNGETAFDLYNGLTEYLTHGRSYKETAGRSREENAFHANWGGNEAIRQRFLSLV